ncbi:hypothetical protein KJ969_01065 [Patescibacteria group bacterium]|nr:hypothetical protein [Patescibacteria group bacterium]MBU1922449.1 hypothetical protein [Patescibacteria group bacterium]
MLVNKSLKNLGLSDKEAKVYLAALELGPQPVQEIAKRASVNRATTYVMIESLTRRGLMSSFDKGKKRYFSAEEPDRLLSILKSEEREIREKEGLIKKIMPDLLAIYAAQEHKPRVRFFEGLEGVQSIQQDILASGGKYMDSAIDVDEYRKHYRDEDFLDYRKKLEQKKLKHRIIFTTQGPPPYEKSEIERLNMQVKYLPKEKFIFPGEMNLYGDRVALFTYKGKVIGVIIESVGINQMLRALYNLAWDGANK